jgi:hypothetical protein
MQTLRESTPLTEAAPTGAGPTEFPIHVITPGWGSSGYYSPEVCEAAAGLVQPGTQMFLDHPSESERVDRPERSVRDIAAVVTEAGTWDAEAQAIVAKCRPLAEYRDTIAELAPFIGLSITGAATDVYSGEAEGRRGPIIEGLARIDSIDFVTRAGRGGKVLSVLESARGGKHADRLAEASANERRDQLESAIRAAHVTKGDYCWVSDFDEAHVWFRFEPRDGASAWYQQGYQTTDTDEVALLDDLTKVRQVTRFVPVEKSDLTENVPATRLADTTTESKEDTMPQIQIEEAEHQRLLDAAGRVETLEAERVAATERAEQAEAALAESNRIAAARAVIATRATEAGVTFTALEERGLLADLPTSEDGNLDEAAFTATVDEAATASKSVRDSGKVTGFGATLNESKNTITESPRVSPWGRKEA